MTFFERGSSLLHHIIMIMELGVFETKTCCYVPRGMAVVQTLHIIQMNCYINHRMCLNVSAKKNI